MLQYLLLSPDGGDEEGSLMGNQIESSGGVVGTPFSAGVDGVDDAWSGVPVRRWGLGGCLRLALYPGLS